MKTNLPVVIIGAGPVGLAAAAHLHSFGESFVVLEKGAQAGSHIEEWSHVRLFSPWKYNLDKAAVNLLKQSGWTAPDPEHLPTGRELIQNYLAPVAALPEIKDHLLFHTEVAGISKQNLDKLSSKNRSSKPFLVYTRTKNERNVIQAKAVIDASGTWGKPNPPSADGLWMQSVPSEKIHTHIPDLTNELTSFAHRHTVVIGCGHSALNTLLSIAALKNSHPGTTISWIVRKDHKEKLFGGKKNDELEARGALGDVVEQLVNLGIINLFTSFHVTDILEEENTLIVQSSDGRKINGVDEVIANTGARPDVSFLQELRLELDPAVESTPALAPLIDPNLHSCGTVRPHGEKQLRHPEYGFYIAGAKSYGRAPTFLMLTGYEQVRSIAAYIAGNYQAAEKIELQLPQTGVCMTASPLSTDAVNQKNCCNAAL